MNKGYVHIYTGNGKGKTTAAFGVALRSVMTGRQVYVGQFIKGMKYSEVGLEALVDNLRVEQYGLECFIERDPTPEDHEKVAEGFKKALEILKSGKYDLVILDEIFIAYHYKMLDLADLKTLITEKHPEVEVIMTGRYCPEALYELADLVTEMKEIKHYYQQGVLSRRGIDV